MQETRPGPAASAEQALELAPAQFGNAVRRLSGCSSVNARVPAASKRQTERRNQEISGQQVLCDASQRDAQVGQDRSRHIRRRNRLHMPALDDLVQHDERNRSQHNAHRPECLGHQGQKGFQQRFFWDVPCQPMLKNCRNRKALAQGPLRVGKLFPFIF